MALPSVHTFKWGIFDVAYEAKKRSYAPDISPTILLQTFRGPGAHVWRFLRDVYCIAPITFSVYVAASAWLSISPAITLRISYLILQKIEALTRSQDIGKGQLLQTDLMFAICTWLFCAFVSVIVERLKNYYYAVICAVISFHPWSKAGAAIFGLSTKWLRAPPASLNADVEFLHDHESRRYFPNANSFGEGGPGWDLLKALGERFQNLVSLILELAVLLLVLSQRNYLDKCLLGGLTGLFFIVLIFAPSNGVNGAGYTFWTTNAAYNRLHLLYALVFGDRLRETLAKDGLNDYIWEEYRKYSKALGVVKSDVLTLACVLPPPWYWAVSRSLLLDYPMALCALLLTWSSSPYIITTLVFFQSATNTLRYSIESLRRGYNPRSLSSLLVQVQAFYKPLDQVKATHQEPVPYPNPSLSPKKGMEIELKDVIFKYRDGVPGVAAVENVSLTIPTNSLVLLVGANGSGKTTLLKLLARLQKPTSGEILIDGTPIADYDLLGIRKHITFLMQSEEIYPVSLRENLLMTVPHGLPSDEKAREVMDEAVRLGGAEQLIERIGYEAVLNPPSLLGQSLRGCGNGIIGAAAFRELEKHVPRREIPISNGEKQRFLASRSFMRLLNSDTRLLMVDEPTSALDPIAERDLFERFREQRDDKTAIFVTHRFGTLAKQADLIVCMKDGKIVERGRHDELMASHGEYARLYNAQQIHQEAHKE